MNANVCQMPIAVNIQSNCTRLHSQSGVYKIPVFIIISSSAKLWRQSVADICIKASLLQHQDYVFGACFVILVPNCLQKPLRSMQELRRLLHSLTASITYSTALSWGIVLQ